ncbi:MAG: helix-turn-helix domain-containing protein [Solirubrobacteraceae bacterium]
MALNNERLLTAAQAAEALSATSQTIRNWIRSGRLSAVRIGARFYVTAAEVERFRGEGARASRGESVWEFDEDSPEVSLPRASPPASGATAERVIGE